MTLARRRLDRDSMLYRATRQVAGILVAGLLRGLAWTWRIEIEGPDPFESTRDSGEVTGPDEEPFVIVAWHRNLFAALCIFRDRGLVIPVSRSRDGDWITSVIGHMGFGEGPRGSSSDGASTLLRSLVRAVRSGQTVGILPDGPRGPAGVAQPGVIALARMTGARLCTAGTSADRAWRFGSWDRPLLPKPFARVRCRFGKTLHVPKGSSEEALAAALAELQEELHRLDDGLDAELTNPL